MPQSSSQQPPKKVAKRVAVSGAELLLLILLVIVGMGIWVWVEREFNELFHDRQPNELRVQQQHHVFELEDNVSKLRDERKATHDQLVATRLEEFKQEAIIGTLAAAHPELARDPSGATLPVSFSREIIASYKDARKNQMLASQLHQTLKARLDAVTSELRNATTRLEDGKQAASKEFHRAQALYLLIKPAITFAVTLVIVSIFLFIIRRLIPARARNTMSTAQSSWPFLIVIGALFILFGYQAFEVAGAAFVAIIFFLIVLARIPWPSSSGETG